MLVEFPDADDSAIFGVELLLLAGDGACDETLDPSSVDAG
jgi:hypothetical protein